METVEISANLREGRGKSEARRARRQGRVPATFYGPQRTAVSIDVDAREFGLRVANLEGSHLIRLQSSATEIGGRVALLRELQVHPVTGALLHADLYEVDLAKKIEVKVPLHLTGKSIGVAQQGGILQPVLREISVECLPLEIPEFLELDVSELGIHDSLHISDIKVPEGVTIVFEANETVVTVLSPQIEQVKAEGEGEAAKEGAPAEAGKAAAAPAAKAAAKPAAKS